MQDAAALLQEMQRNLQYSRENFYKALYESGKYCSFQAAVMPELDMDMNETHEHYIERWLEAAGLKKTMSSKGYDLVYSALCELGTGAGQADIQRLEYKRRQLEDEAGQLYERERRDAKLYRALGGYGGLAAALLLL